MIEPANRKALAADGPPLPASWEPELPEIANPARFVLGEDTPTAQREASFAPPEPEFRDRAHL